MHSSTVTVAVLPEPDEREVPIDPRELRWETNNGSTGAGGQHANTSDSAVRLIHRPAGIEVNVEGRLQQRNRVRALRVVRARLVQAARQAERSHRTRERSVPRRPAPRLRSRRLPLGYGAFYAERFLSEVRPEVSEAGQAFLDAVSARLPQEMAGFADADWTCSEVRDHGFDSHPDCSTEEVTAPTVRPTTGRR